MNHAWDLVEDGARRTTPGARLVEAAEQHLPPLDGRVAPAPAAARPFVVGYVCEQLLVGPADLERTKDRLHEYAAAADFHLGSIYVEHDVDGRVGFQALMAAIERYDVRHVLVPGLAHVQPIGRESKKAHIEHFTQATVQVAGSP